MGSAFIVVFWLMLATLFALATAGLVWVGQRGRVPALRRRRVVLAAVLPYMLMLWFVPTSCVWYGWGRLTGVNASFVVGAYWSEPLPNDYVLGRINGSFVILPRGGGEIRISGIREIAVAGDIVFGTSSAGSFVFDTAGGLDPPDFASLRARRPLGSVYDFPGRPQTLWDILLWYAFWLVPPLLLARHWWRAPALAASEDIYARATQ